MGDWTKPRTSQDIPFISKDAIERETKGNLDYLKTTADTTTTNVATNTAGVATNVTDIATNTAAIAAIDTTSCVMRDGTTVAYATPSGTRVKSTIYRNTSGKIRFVDIVCYGTDVDDALDVFVGVGTPPTVLVAAYISTSATEFYQTLTFIVPPNYYYKANESNATITIPKWTEWDIL